jgi:hypothetical protein
MDQNNYVLFFEFENFKNYRIFLQFGKVIKESSGKL